jgi:hypothetical protein
MKDSKKLRYDQRVKQVKHPFPKSNILVPYPSTALLIMIDGPGNAIVVQLITQLYKNKHHFRSDKSEIDVIHFVVGNTPSEALNRLSMTEIMHLLNESMRTSVDKINEALSREYPKAKKIPYYTRKQLKNTWDGTVAGYKQRNPNQNWLMGKGGIA